LTNNNGTSNTLFGFNAGTSNISGFYNTFIGDSAGALNNTHYSNTFIGHLAGYDNSGAGGTFHGSLIPLLEIAAAIIMRMDQVILLSKSLRGE